MTTRPTPTISLTPELDAFISAALAAGRYANADEAVRAGLAMLRDASSRDTETPWPIGGGECGKRIREHDWEKSSLGPVGNWSDALRTTVSNVVNSPVPKVLMWGPDHIMLYNDGYIEIAGKNHPRALGGTVPGIWPEIWDFNRSVLERGMRGEIVSYHDQPMVLMRNGAAEDVVFELFYTPIYEIDGSVGGVLCTVVENTDRVRAEQAAKESARELKLITDTLPMLVGYVDKDHVYRFVNSQYEEVFGQSAGEIIGRHVRDTIGEAMYARRRPALERALAGETFTADIVLPAPDGTPRRAEARYVPRVEDDGSIPGVYVVAIDVEERAQRELEVAASNGRFRAAMDAVHGVLWTNSADGRMLGEQPGWAALTGQTFEEYQGYGWSKAVHPEDSLSSVDAWNAAVAAKSMFIHEHRVRRHDGNWRTFAIRALPIFGDDGEISEWVGVHTDITHQRAAEASLRQQAEDLAAEVKSRERAELSLRELNEDLEARVIAEIAERRAAEVKLAQAQKMETVGKLTGGVAHDFNNLLQVISGNLQLLARDVVGSESAERRVSNAMAGVMRGSKLAAQLLAFGRRQALEPKVVNVTRFVRDMDDMLRRAIGEGIEVETVFAGGLWNTFIDPTQIENALLNLAINARDAMNGSGKLTIELSNAHLDDDYARTHEEVTPGQYVMLAVSDTGCGMAPDILDKVFEPFFSTKAEGKGSGLGLSMVYGFVKQSGGHVKIYSEVSHGTTIKLYLPRAMEAEDVEVLVQTGPIAGGTETVLVVEDDDDVRATVVEMLGDLGYRVLKAIDASSALAVIESGVSIDILFTDVVMPGTLKSPELARKARERLPNVAVLFTSGYTENSIVHGGRLDAGVELLSKPYTREALARKLRHVLSNQGQRRLASSRPAGAEPKARPQVSTEAAQPTVLLVEDDTLIRANTADMLKLGGCVVVEAGSAEDALAILQTTPIDVLLTDVSLPGESGVELARRARALKPSMGLAFASGDVSSLAGSGLEGAVVLAKPYSAEAVMDAVRSALDAHVVQPDKVVQRAKT